MRSLSLPVFSWLITYGGFMCLVGYQEARRRYRADVRRCLSPFLTSDLKSWQVVPLNNVVDWEERGWA